MKTDSQLQHDVLAHLEWEPSVDATQIGVAAKDGVITVPRREPFAICSVFAEHRT